MEIHPVRTVASLVRFALAVLAFALSACWTPARSTPAFAAQQTPAPADERPHIIFVMADDMGWGQTGYRGHPALKTPNLDAMAAAGLRFERFYAACPVCSPTRASVLTGRANDRTGVLSHGYALRLQEKTVAQALQRAGYVTGHFGKWHLNGLRGPGVPVLASDPRNPGAFGFDQWVSVTNFFDLNPVLSRGGQFEEFQGDSSETTVAETIKFLERHHKGDKPMFAVVWFGTPHSPFRALPADKALFPQLDDASANHYGELVAMDRSLGALRRRLRELKIAERTMLVFCSDNGGLPEVKPDSVGGLRGNKGSVYEGGLRVPGVIEWPAGIRAPRTTHFPAGVIDLFPTVVDLLNLPNDVLVRPVDGTSLKPLLAAVSADAEPARRERPLPFRYQNKLAWIDGRYKLLTDNRAKGEFQLYDLETDPRESRDVGAEQPEIAARMKSELLAWNDSVDASFAGKDYPAGRVDPPDPKSMHWNEKPEYQPFFANWRSRPEYQAALKAADDPAAPPKKKDASKAAGKNAATNALQSKGESK